MGRYLAPRTAKRSRIFVQTVLSNSIIADMILERRQIVFYTILHVLQFWMFRLLLSFPCLKYPTVSSDICERLLDCYIPIVFLNVLTFNELFCFSFSVTVFFFTFVIKCTRTISIKFCTIISPLVLNGYYFPVAHPGNLKPQYFPIHKFLCYIYIIPSVKW